MVASHLILTQLHVMQFVTHLWSKLLLFIRYLSIARDKEMKPGVKEGVDTLLLKLYAQLEDTEQLKLLTASPNSCVLVCVQPHRDRESIVSLYFCVYCWFCYMIVS